MRFNLRYYSKKELESNFKLEIKQLADTNNLTYEETLESWSLCITVTVSQILK
jgi:hypothetical protein